MGTPSYTVARWREVFKPLKNPFEADSIRFQTENAEQEQYLSAQPDNTVWTQLWDWDDEKPLVVSGLNLFGPKSRDVMAYFVTEVPWGKFTIVHGAPPETEPNQ